MEANESHWRIYAHRIVDYTIGKKNSEKSLRNQISYVYRGWFLGDALKDILQRDFYHDIENIIVVTKCRKTPAFKRITLEHIKEKPQIWRWEYDASMENEEEY